MAWYGSGGWDYYPPYVSVGEKRAHGMLALTKLLKKSKRKAEPVVIAARKRQLATTFWGKAWCDNLERYADLANRLPRGRTYLRNGSVLDLAIAEGRIEAYVAGSELYRVTIGIAPLAKTRWRRVVTRCTGRIGSLVGLLRGELSDDVLAVLTDAKDGLFPEPREMTLDCSCPDSAERVQARRRGPLRRGHPSRRQAGAVLRAAPGGPGASCSARPPPAPCRAGARPRASASPTIGCPRCSGSSWRTRRRRARLVRVARRGGVSDRAESVWGLA